MGAVELAGALADPEHVGRAVVPVARQRVLPGQRLLVAEEQRLVARVDVDLVELRRCDSSVDPAGPHEAQGPLDLVGERLVALPSGAAGHELLRPRVDPGQVGEAALGERPQQVQRRRRLVVGLHEPLRVGHAGRGGRGLGVDDVAAEAGELGPVDELGGRRAGLGELAGDPSHLHHGHADRVGEHDRHLQDDLELLPDADGREVVEALRAVAGLEEEGVAGGDPRRGRPCRARASPAKTSGG